IDADNVILDCKGFEINYSTSADNSVFGINITDHSNVTVRNCFVNEGGNDAAFPPLTNNAAIVVSDSTDVIIRNSTITGERLGTSGINLNDASFTVIDDVYI